MYCESEAGSCCSTPFVSAPSSPSRGISSGAALNNLAGGPGKNNKSKNSLYYYFSAPSSPPRDHKSATSAAAAGSASDHQRGFSFTECEFQFHSRFDGSDERGVASPPGRRHDEEEDEMEDAEMEMGSVTGFYFSAPTSPDRRNKDRLAKCSYWDEMPGTPKMIFGAAAANAAAGDLASGPSFFNADSDFEFSSSRMSDSDSTISAQMSSADELFFKGQLLPMKIPPPPQLTSSDSSGSSNTVASTASSSASAAAAAPLSPRSSRKGGGSASPGRVKSVVMGSICGGAAMIKSGSISDSISASLAASSGARGGGPRSLSPLQLLKKYQSMMLMMGRPSTTNSSSSSSPSLASSSSTGSSASDQQVPRPARTSSKGRTLRELLHLSSMRRSRSKPAAQPPPASKEEKKATVSQEASKEIIKETTPTKEQSNSPSKPLDPITRKLDSSKRFVDKSLDHSKRFSAGTTTRTSPGIPNKKRFHSIDIHSGATGGYYNHPRRLHSGSIVPEADFPATIATAKLPHHRRDKNKRLNYHVAHYRRGSTGGGMNAGAGGMFHSGPMLGGGAESARFGGEVLHGIKGGGVDQLYYYSNSGASSACSSRNVSPRRSRNNSVNSSSGSCNMINLNSSSNSFSSSSGGGGGISLHELHYKSQQRVTSEEMRRKTFLPYKQGLLGCLGCATMRIAGLSKSLQPMASSR